MKNNASLPKKSRKKKEEDNQLKPKENRNANNAKEIPIVPRMAGYRRRQARRGADIPGRARGRTQRTLSARRAGRTHVGGDRRDARDRARIAGRAHEGGRHAGGGTVRTGAGKKGEQVVQEGKY